MITNNNKTIQSVNIGNKTVASLTNGGGSKTIDLTPQSPGITINVSYLMDGPITPFDNVTITYVRTLEQIASHRPSGTYEVTFPEEGYYRFELTGQFNRFEIIHVDSSMTDLTVEFMGPL